MPRAASNSMEDDDEAICFGGLENNYDQSLAQVLMQQVLNAAGARRAKFSTAAPAPELAVSKRKKAAVEKEPPNIICGFVFEKNDTYMWTCCRIHWKRWPLILRETRAVLWMLLWMPLLLLRTLWVLWMLLKASACIHEKNFTCNRPHAGDTAMPVIASSTSADDPTRLSTMSLSPGTLDNICVGNSTEMLLRNLLVMWPFRPACLLCISLLQRQQLRSRILRLPLQHQPWSQLHCLQLHLPQLWSQLHCQPLRLP